MSEFAWGGVDFAALYGLPERDLSAARGLHRTGGFLRIPIGIGSTGNPVALQIPTASEIGANGIVVGRSGSGKSELLRTAVVGAAVSYPPEDISFFIVDFRGDGVFDEVADLPHVSGMVSGVVQDLSLADRIESTLIGELTRRQELYTAAGNFANTTEYQRARQAGADLEPLPKLVVVIDALDELLSRRPQFAEAVVAVSRAGRSHGLTLLASAQQLAENTFRGVDNHFTYRIVLGNLSADESQRVLGTDEAHMLPDVPGHAYLRDGHLEPTRFTAAHPTRIRRPHDISSNDADDRTQLEIIVSQMHSHDQPTRTIWLPPLDEAPTLDQLMPAPITHRPVSTLRVPIGIVDRPNLQRRDPLIVDLSGAQGNIGICGVHLSGKSTALQSLIMALALTHTAEQVQFYCFDINRQLAVLEQLPHVGSVARLEDKGMLRRTLNQLTALMQYRERYFRETDIESMDQFRRLRAMDSVDNPAASAAIRDDPFGDVFLVIDTLRYLWDIGEVGFYRQIAHLVARGPAYGVHVIVALKYWSDAHSGLDEAFGTRLELHQPELRYFSSDSEIAQQVSPRNRPGCGSTSEGHDIRMALPRLNGNTHPETLDNATALAVAKIRADTPGRPAPAIYPLPELLDRDEVLRRSGNWPSGVESRESCLRFPIGIDETHHAPVYLDFGASPHLIIIGEPGCGKTTVLRSIIAAICASNTVDQARFVLVDYRATGLVDSIPREFLAGYGPDVQTAEHLFGDLAQYLDRRMPRPQESTRRAPERWWSGPDIFVVIDDHELASTRDGNPAHRLTAALPYARQVGFHLIIARSSIGAARGMYDGPPLAQLRELGTTALLMSGDRSEGELIGRIRPEELPPGRGILLTRSGQEYIQTAWTPPT
ncbi:type VII secretion protein EccCb [Nocardia jiangxiensis]|uniref:Type VII secretion protein EccCb n=1 Tax=Nocardia jiangxiensis TaxID=282685 RepID=A0ABW6SFU7_9NOCA